jgi:sulfite dehydrogenase (cytochrome) subunit B
MTMKRSLALVTILTLAGGMTAATLAKPVTYTLPAETATLKQTRDPGYLKAEALCTACHSRDYMTTQPPHKGKEFWAAEVTKMVTVYGAPIPEPDRAVIAEYLAAVY